MSNSGYNEHYVYSARGRWGLDSLPSPPPDYAKPSFYKSFPNAQVFLKVLHV